MIIAVVLGVLAVAIVGCCVSAALGVGIFGAISRQISGPGATETVSKTFSVSQRPTLVIHDTAGNVTVTPGPDGQVAINATKRVRGVSDADARRILGQLQVDMTQDGNTVTVETHFPSGSNLGSRSVDIDVTAPAASQLTFDLTAGNVTVRKISGQMSVTTTAGNIETEDVTFAGASQFSATAGNVTLDGQMSSASTLQAQVKTGNITLRLPATTPAHLDARTDIGNVSVHGWSVTATRQGAGMQAVGDLNPSATDQITLRANTGNISVEQR